MKIIIISTCPTHPAISGNSRFILNQVNLFQRLGHDVHFLYINEKPLFGKNNKSELNELCVFWQDRLHIFNVTRLNHLKNILKIKYRNIFDNAFYKCDDYYIPSVEKYLKEINSRHHFDVCIVNYYYLSKLLTKTDICKKGLVTHDYFAYKSLLVNNKIVAYNTNAHEEAIALQRSPHIFALNSEEAIYFSKLSPLSSIYNIYSCFEYHPTKVVGNHNILFLSGSNQYNINGINWFLRNIWPKIKQRFDDVNLIIGGSICNKKYFIDKDDKICYFGLVDNADEFYSLGDIVINPTYQGTGLKIKTFESVSYDKITLCNPHSTIGIFDIDTAPIFSSYNATDWVKYLERIWSNEEFILLHKNNNMNYITRMQEFIECEYNRFFNS